jgi:GNAT superfamily N-acetyltransferase
METTNDDFKNARITVRRLNSDDAGSVYAYLLGLSPQSKKRFGPHPFDLEAVTAALSDTGSITAYGAYTEEPNDLISYVLIRHGYNWFDKDRYNTYGIDLSEASDCTFAPSVADAWQNRKIGSRVFNLILNDLPSHFKRMILWGGVQADNAIAVTFYRRKDFQLLGEFEHNGKNYDMMLTLHPDDVE